MAKARLDSAPSAVTAIRKALATGNLTGALQAALYATAKWPKFAEGFFYRGVIEAQLGQFDEAAKSLQRAKSWVPNPPWTWDLTLVNVLRDQGDLQASRQLAQRLLTRVPERPEAHNALGLTCRALRDFDAAARAFAASIAASATYQPGYVNSVNVLLDMGSGEEALTVVRKGLQRVPDAEELYVSQGRAFDALERFPEAKAAYRHALTGPSRVVHQAWRALGRIAAREADLFAAIEAYEAAIRLKADDLDLWIWLGNAYLDVGNSAKARSCFESALQLKPDYAEVFDTLLVCCHYDDDVSPEAVFGLHREWQRRFGPAEAQTKSSTPTRSVRLPLRLGFVSHSMHGRVMQCFLSPLLRHLERQHLGIYGYNAGARLDATSHSLPALCDAWREVGGTTDDQLLRLIQDDELDVVIDLDGHVPGSRLRALTRSLAPLRMSWLDYFDTTGSKSFDILVGDSVSTPADGPQHFVEEVVRLDACRLCYGPPDYVPEVAPSPALRNGFITFGSFNRLSKLAPRVLDAWAALLKEVPDSRLILKSDALAHPSTREVFAQRLVSRGVDAGRLDLRGPSPHQEMLREYGDVDIALDTFPYNGGLTTCEALYMGVPVVALLGTSMISRQSASLLTAAGLPHWIASTTPDWLSLNVSLTQNVGALAQWRAQARSILAQSALMDGPAFAETFATVLRETVARRFETK